MDTTAELHDDGADFDATERRWPTDHHFEPRVDAGSEPPTSPQDDGRGRVRGFRSAAASGAALLAEGRTMPSIFDFSGLTLGVDPLPVTLGHVSSRLIGHASRVAIVPDGVLVEGVVWLGTAHAGQVLASSDLEWQASIVVRGRLEHVPAGESAVVNGGTVAGPVDIVREGRLVELGFTLAPADSSTVVRFEREKPGAVESIREKLRARGALEPVALLEAWDLLQPTTRRRLADVVLETVGPAEDEEAESDGPVAASDPYPYLEDLQAAGEMERALLFHLWDRLDGGAQQAIVRLVRDDLAPSATV